MSDCDTNCRYLRWVFGLLVFAQFAICLTIVFSFPSPYAGRSYTGAIAIAAIALGISAVVSMGRKSMNVSPALRMSAELRTSGVYRWIRHPMYTALLIFCGTYAFSNISLRGSALWGSLLLVLVIKMHYEERLLRERFSGYADYASRVKRLIPFLV